MTSQPNNKLSVSTHLNAFRRTNGDVHVKSIECETCGLKFEPTRKWHKFCSAKCRKAGFLERHSLKTRIENHERRISLIEQKLGIKLKAEGIEVKFKNNLNGLIK